MAESKKRLPNPEFRSLDEEEEYWKTHSPIVEGYEGKIQRPRQKRSSFLAVRLTGEELTQLRDIAAKQGLGPSTFARLVLTSVIEREHQLPKRLTSDEVRKILQNNMPRSVKEQTEDLFKEAGIGDPDNPLLLVVDPPHRQAYEDLTLSLVSAILKMAGVQVITPMNESYEKVRELVEAKTGVR